MLLLYANTKYIGDIAMEYQTAHLSVRRLYEEDREAIIQLLTDPIVTKTYMVKKKK